MPKISELRGLFKPFTKPLHRQWKWVWQEKGKFNEPKLTLPKALEGRQINIIDPLHEPDPNAFPDESTSWTSPTRHPMFEYLVPPLPREEHPLFHHERPVFLFDSKAKLHAGVDQACLLTKTIPFYELPQSIKQTIGQVSLPDQDELIQSYIRQSIAYDATKEHLPRKKSPLKQRRSFRIEYAIPRSRQMAILLENIIHLCESLGGHYPDLFKRHLYRNIPFYTTYERYGELIHLKRKNEYVLTSHIPLSPIVKRLNRLEINSGDNIDEKIASHDPNGHYVMQANDYQFLDMYPIYPTIDLPSEQLYQNGDEQGWHQRKSNEYVHTTLHVSNDELIHEATTDERLARMIMFAFGSALVQARQLYPDGRLVKPVTVQSIFLLDELFHFVVFQLNTLNYNDTNDKQCNYVWIDKDNYLYDNRPSMVMHNPLYGTERNLQRYVLEKLKYNPVVFQKFLALYLHGVK
ncbi:unnamed protein product [Rotaria socialis]|uniref:Ribosomal protein L37 n=1 Tax=Rotaria socialis TaxID=392032 RepID=A0A820Y1A4_9BILA|nr:unnamed protein product [Rotaria socialis]CAF4540702.1 unnamed protein product [Rotaria socialis]